MGWLGCYLASSWLSNIGQGLVVTVVGPSQPYIAKNVGVSIDTINLLWTFQFFGFMVGSISSGFIFKRLKLWLEYTQVFLFLDYPIFSSWLSLFFLYLLRYFKTSAQKTMYLFVNMAINGLVMITLPFLRSFGLLVTARCIQNIALGMYITADAR